MLLSECCSAPPWGTEEYGICGDCKEHCGFYDDEELVRERMEFTPEQEAIIAALMVPVCVECGEPVARFSDGATLHHKDGCCIDVEADADHAPRIKEG